VGIKYKHVEICCACTKQETGHVEMAHWSRILKRVDVEEKEEKMYKKTEVLEDAQRGMKLQHWPTTVYDCDVVRMS
jgi:hypothetical protein